MGDTGTEATLWWYAACVIAFGCCVLTTAGGNSRCFGLLKDARSFITSAELLDRYDVLFLPAAWGFAVWEYISFYEIALLSYVGIARFGIVAATLDAWDPAQGLWVVSNLVQTVTVFALCTQRLRLAAFSSLALVASLIGLGTALDGLADTEYLMITVPVWLHAGYALTIACITWQLMLASLGFSEAAMLAAAFAALFALVALPSAVLATVGLAALPLALIVLWTLWALRSRLGGRLSALGVAAPLPSHASADATNATVSWTAVSLEAMSTLADALLCALAVACVLLVPVAIWQGTHTWQVYS